MTINDENADESNEPQTTTHVSKQVPHQYEVAVADEELHKLLLPNIDDLPPIPPSAIETNFVAYFAPGHFLNFISSVLCFADIND